MNRSDLFRRKTIAQVIAQTHGGADGTRHANLSRQLTARDLAALGIAAIVGAGIFSTIGIASADGGPGVVLLFIFTAIACSCTALAYAEFAAMVPVAGSAYTYSYVAFGEIIAWIIGWALIMEYSVGNAAVAVSWSDYFSAMLESVHIHIPDWAGIDHVSANRGFDQAIAALAGGKALADLDPLVQAGYRAWLGAPTIGGFHIIADIPAVMITLLITWLAYTGIKESRNANNIMVGIKLAVIALVIVVGIFHIQVSHWSPFLPNGIPGVLQGVSAVFFAYIGFDAISTMAEECKDPEHDMPRGIGWAILISTVLYVLIALVLTGIVGYEHLRVGDPLAFVFESIGMKWLSAFVAVSAVVAMASVLLVFQLGQPRIWLAMSRDGLLPDRFATIHPRYHTPSYATLVTAVVVILPTLLIPSREVLHLCSMGTLVAFVLVCGGVLRLQHSPERPAGKFRTPYINGKYVLPALMACSALAVGRFGREWFFELLSFASWDSDKNKVPMYLFIGLCAVLTVLVYRKNLSLIPVLGLLFSFFMMAQIPFMSWIGFAVWLLVGMAVYFSFGVRHSRLATGAGIQHP